MKPILETSGYFILNGEEKRIIPISSRESYKIDDIIALSRILYTPCHTNYFRSDKAYKIVVFELTDREVEKESEVNKKIRESNGSLFEPRSFKEGVIIE